MTGTRLVGRCPEMAWLQQKAGLAREGREQVALVRGEPGIGKSALLEAFAEDCAAAGMRVVTGCARELERDVPFALLGECLGAWDPGAAASVPARIRDLLAGLATSPWKAEDYAFSMADALAECLDTWCVAGPVALIVDDAQWMDTASTRALARAVSTVGLPLLLVIATRPGEQATALDAAFSAPGRPAADITLGLLSDEAVAELAQARLGADAPSEHLETLRSAGGHPLFLTQLIAILGEGGDEKSDEESDERSVGSTARAGGRAVAGSLVDVLSIRVGSLPERTRSVLALASLLGSGFEIAELSAVVGMRTTELLAPVQEALAAGLLVCEGAAFRFHHELIRQACAEGLPAPLVGALRLDAAKALAMAGAGVERVSEQLMLADRLDGEAVRWLLEAGSQLARRAPEMAIVLLSRARAHAGPGADADQRIDRALARALWADGRLAEAEEMLRRMVSRDTEDAELALSVAQLCYEQGRLQDAIDACGAALAEHGGHDPLHGRLAGLTALCRFWLTDDAGALEWGARAVEAGRRGGEPRAVVLGQFTRATAMAQGGSYQEALDLLAELPADVFGDAELAAEYGLPPYLIRGFTRMELDLFEDGDLDLGLGMRESENGRAMFLPWYHSGRAAIRYLDGRWDDALADVQTARRLDDPLLLQPGLEDFGDIITLRRGAAPSRYAHVPGRLLGQPRYAFNRAVAHALVLEAEGDARAAFDRLATAWSEHSAIRANFTHPLIPELARLASVAERTAEFRELVRSIEQVARHRTTAPSALAAVALCRGVAQGDIEQLIAAARHYQQAGRVICEAVAWEEAAVLHARASRTGESRDCLEEAARAYGVPGAVWDISRAEARLRALGVRRGVRGRRDRPKSGWQALTPTERRVADLLGDGLSNVDIAARMFTSHRTVQTHVSNILAKTGAPSRFEIAARLPRPRG
ncbi:AAA family ATPase [Streptomyces sp. NPDC002054]|uniref:helix-turn-helix transcriptional regulator n=1 Tax=Streptomyces sp. NPDC002054 TaxID=3154663 RepID=UPI00331AF89C